VRPKAQKDELAEEYKSKPGHNPFGGAKPRDEVRRALHPAGRDKQQGG